jgi:hypothetical protein
MLRGQRPKSEMDGFAKRRWVLLSARAVDAAFDLSLSLPLTLFQPRASCIISNQQNAVSPSAAWAFSGKPKISFCAFRCFGPCGVRVDLL